MNILGGVSGFWWGFVGSYSTLSQFIVIFIVIVIRGSQRILIDVCKDHCKSDYGGHGQKLCPNSARAL